MLIFAHWQIVIASEQTGETILIGLEKTAYLFDRCAIYETLYIKTGRSQSPALENILLRLYDAVLAFLAEAIKRSQSEPSIALQFFEVLQLTLEGGVLKSVFSVEELGKYLDRVKEYEDDLVKQVQVADIECTDPVFCRSNRTNLNDCFSQIGDNLMRYNHSGMRVSNDQLMIRANLTSARPIR